MTHKHWMQQALKLATQAEAIGEVPVGAVVVHDNKIIGRGFNQPISSHDPTAHAEIIALRDAAATMGNYRLPGATLYVTLEPCHMCAGAIVHSRIEYLVYGAREPKAGAVESQARFFEAPYLNHRPQYEGGVCADECGAIIRRFFAAKRSA